MSASAPARLIWLSDLHFETEGLVLGHGPFVRLRAAVAHINAHYADADLCLITGDIVDTGTPDNYRAVREELEQLALPWHPMTGNHDGRGVFLEHMPLPVGALDGFAQYEIVLPRVRLICLDSLWEGQDAGQLCDARMGWLEARLRAADTRPVIIFLHHPPVDLGLPMLDPDRLSNGADLMALLARFPQVNHVCCGHVHRPVVAQAGAITVTSLRAVLYQAPAPLPAWDWESFAPPREAPEMGVITVESGQITLRMEQFCAYEVGGPV